MLVRFFDCLKNLFLKPILYLIVLDSINLVILLKNPYFSKIVFCEKVGSDFSILNSLGFSKV